jgi:hypothetical protein
MLRLLRALARALALASPLTTIAFALLFACNPDPPTGDVCEQASRIFNECGASLPTLAGTCSATKKAIATCITMNATNCEALAGLYERLDVCVANFADGGDPELGSGEIPTVSGEAKTIVDAGRDAKKPDSKPADASSPPTSPSPQDAAVEASIIDAGPPPWTGMDATGTIASGITRYFVTPVLEPGTYHFALTGTGDADLYVRKGAAPNTTTWDCRPFLAGTSEACAITLDTSAAIHVMLRGVATSSTFNLAGRP